MKRLRSLTSDQVDCILIGGLALAIVVGTPIFTVWVHHSGIGH